jgi:hypothetical protein
MHKNFIFNGSHYFTFRNQAGNQNSDELQMQNEQLKKLIFLQQQTLQQLQQTSPLTQQYLPPNQLQPPVYYGASLPSVESQLQPLPPPSQFSTPPVAPRKKIMLILFSIAFLIVTIGLIVGVVGTTQYQSCITNSGPFNLSQCVSKYNTLLAGWIVFGFGLIICCIDCCLAVGYSLAH